MAKSKVKNVKVMIGSGEHAIFKSVPKGKKMYLMRAGMTFSEARHHLEEKELEYLNEIEDRCKKREIKTHVLSIFNRV